MHVLRIADVPDNRFGGMSRTMYGTGDVLAARGHQIEYLLGDAFRGSGPVQLRRFTVPLKILSAIRRLSREGRRYDLVEIHEPLAAAYCWVRRTRRKVSPLVVFSYGLEERSHQALLRYRRLKGLPVSLKNRYSPLTVVLQAKYAVRHADHVICSNAEDVRYLECAGVPAQRLTQHHSGVEPEFLEAGRQWTDQPRSGILFMGTWLPRKGVLDLVPAVSEVLRKHPAVQFTAAGCGVDEQRVLSDFAPNLRARLRVLPEVKGNQHLIDLYRQHSVLVLPSFFEGQPLVMIEAAAMGLAIVTTPICGMADFIVDRENGLTAAVGNVRVLTERLEETIQNPLLARQLGESARRTAQAYTWANAAAKIELAYEKTVAAAAT